MNKLIIFNKDGTLVNHDRLFVPWLNKLIYNLSGIAMGVLTLIVKHGVKEIIKRLGIKKVQKEEIIDNIEDEFDDIDNDPSIHNLNDNI